MGGVCAGAWVCRCARVIPSSTPCLLDPIGTLASQCPLSSSHCEHSPALSPRASPLSQLLYQGTAPILRALVAAGGDVNVADTHGHTPMMALAQFRHGDYLERAKVLLEHPALDLDARGLPWDLRKVMQMYM